MIVCSCNAIREADIRAAARRGCASPESAYRSMGCDFQCGSCRDFAEELIDHERSRYSRVDAKAA